jgi:hypothetical protein
MQTGHSSQRRGLFLKIASFFALFFCWTLSGYGQGSLTPPGAPAPTMKTLDQVEARVIVNAANCPGSASNSFIISQPGSYYLTGNITGESGKVGISIGAAGVTLDLNGFDVIGVPGATEGILSTLASVTVRNGTVRDWPIRGLLLLGSNGVVENVKASGNGQGINTSFAIVDHCSVTGNGSGFQVNNGQLSNSSAIANTGLGVSAQDTIVTNCVVRSNGNGLITLESLVKDCSFENNASNGIEAQQHSMIMMNYCVGNAGSGIIGSGAGSRFEGNFLSNNATGLAISVAGCIARANTVLDNTTNYSFAPGNELELLISKLPVTIDVPAKATMAGTLTGVSGQNGITIASDNVSVDLGGHALVGVAGSLDGILVSGARLNVTVRDGIVRNWGGDGIDAAAASSGGVCTDLELNNNGGAGLHTSSRQLIRSVSSYSNTGDGINAGGANKISNCVATLNGGWGINSTGVDSTIEGCLVNQNTTGGIQVIGSQSLVIGNTIDNSPAGDGLLVGGARCRIDGNHITRSSTGLHVTGTLDVIIRNSVSQSGGTPYNIAAGNDAGPIGTAASSTSPWASFQ